MTETTDEKENTAKEEEEKIVLTPEDLAEAKQIIEDLVKKDKKKTMLLTTLSSVLATGETITGRFSAQSLYFLSGNLGLGGGSAITGGTMEMVQYLIAQRVMNNTDTMLHKDFDRRSRSERSAVNPEKVNNYAGTLSNSAACYLFRKAKMISSSVSAALGVGLTGLAMASNPPLAAAVIGGSLAAAIPQYFLYKRIKNIRVQNKHLIDENTNKKLSFSRQMFQNSKMVEATNSQKFAYSSLQERQENVFSAAKKFAKKIIKYTAGLTAYQYGCAAAALVVSVTAGFPLATTVLATAGVAATIKGFSDIQNAYVGKKEFIETFATAYKKFKSKYKDFEFGKEKVHPHANVLQLDKIAYRHRISEGEHAGERNSEDFFRSSETITFGKGVTILSGASGAGKSTLTELLLHADNVTEGSIKIGTADESGHFDGQDYRSLQAGAPFQNIAISYQKPEMIECTVDEYIRLAAPNADPKKVDEVKKLLGIGLENGGTIDEKKILSPGTKLSGGESTRIGLAQALIKDSPIMILDEPTSGVDEKMSADIVNYLKKLSDKTIIYITHDAKEIEKIGAYQAVDIGKHSEKDEVNTIKTFDLTDKKNCESFVNFFINRKLAEIQKNQKQVKIEAEIDRVRSRQKDLVRKHLNERITAGKTINQDTLTTFKHIKGIEKGTAEKQSAAVFKKISEHTAE